MASTSRLVTPKRRTVAGCLVMVEYETGPLDVQRLPTRPPSVYDWLRTQPRLVTPKRRSV